MGKKGARIFSPQKSAENTILKGADKTMNQAMLEINSGSLILTTVSSFILTVVLIALVLFVYFIPAFVAKKRNHLNKKAILILNIFLGWTFIGYVVALVWACTNQNKDGQN